MSTLPPAASVVFLGFLFRLLRLEERFCADPELSTAAPTSSSPYDEPDSDSRLHTKVAKPSHPPPRLDLAVLGDPAPAAS
jgi:hypothetical protein